jgi:hypothetical protein
MKAFLVGEGKSDIGRWCVEPESRDEYSDNGVMVAPSSRASKAG